MVKKAHFLKSFKLKKAYRDIQPFSVNFLPGLNVIVGENGSGKSTILELMREPTDTETCEKDITPVYFKFLDTEKHNPRTASYGTAPFENMGFMVHSRYKSHGQAMSPLILSAEDFKDLLLLIDEPEAGLSISNQRRALKAFRKAIKNNCQVFLTTHSYVIIDSVPKVFSLDDKKWVPSKVYLDKVMERKT